MANYKVLSDKLDGKQQGDVVSDDDLAGLNIDALIEAEHLAIVQVKATKTEDKDK